MTNPRRLSLPASLLEPIPNLEYWQYADRADIFAAWVWGVRADSRIGDSADETERMLAVLRFLFSKDLKFVRARLGKPYNSALGEWWCRAGARRRCGVGAGAGVGIGRPWVTNRGGRRCRCSQPPPRSVLTPGEYFRCSWRVPPLVLDKDTGEPIVRTHIHVPLPNEPSYGGQGGSGWTTPIVRPEDGGKGSEMSETSSIKSGKSSKSPIPSKSPNSTKLKRVPSHASFDMSTLRQAIPGPGPEIPHMRERDAGVKDGENVTVVFLCEQTSHHPPVSAAYYYCPEKGIEAVGVDQIAARVSFPSGSCIYTLTPAVSLGPGPQNKGIFVRILRDGPGKGEVGVSSSTDSRNTRSRTPRRRSTASSRGRTMAR